MITERKPLGSIDSNIPRVQPTRAAKTSHKWFSNRQQKLDECENCTSPKLLQACTYSHRLALHQIQSNGREASKENLQNNNLILEKNANLLRRESYDNLQLCDNYDAISQNNNRHFRIPLQTLAINPPATVPIIDLTMNNQSSKSGFFHSKNESSQEQSVGRLSTEDTDVSLRSISDDDNSDVPLNKSLTSNKFRKSFCKSDDENTNSVEVLDEYLPDILSYLQTLEVKYKPKANYLEKQTEITPIMRIKLIDWLIEVQEEYKLNNETLYLAVTFVDRFLSEMSVTRNKLQLLGTASMFLAAKFEEIYPPDANEFAYVTADTYTRAEVLLMERMILKVFKCTLAMPTTFQYLTIFLEKSNFGQNIRYLSYYIAEMTLLDNHYLSYLPSIKAAAAVTLAIYTIQHSHDCDVANGNFADSQENNDNQNLDVRLQILKQNNQKTLFCFSVRQAMSSNIDLVYQCALDMANSHLRESNSSHFVREKYSTDFYRNAAAITPLLSGSPSGESCLLSRSNVRNMWNS